MSFPIRRYPLDPTGRSPNNFVTGEEHILGVKAGPYHPLAPFYGPFYNDRTTLMLYRNNDALVFGVDYWGTNLIQDATAKFSGEVCEVLILKDMAEGDVITLSYQNLGGLYQNHAKGLIDLYNAYLIDNRPVDWTKGLRNKPSQYPPAYHLHMLQDVVGWEPVIVAIERLINVLTLRNVPAFEALVDWVIARTLEVVTEEEVITLSPVDKIVSMRRLILASQTLNFNALSIKPRSVRRAQGQFYIFDIQSTNFPNNTVLYWEIEHVSSFPGMFKTEKGALTIDDQEALLLLTSLKQPGSTGEFTFRVRLRRNSSVGPILAVSKLVTLVYSAIWELDYGLLTNGLWTIPTTSRSHITWATPESMFLIPDDQFYKENHA